MSSINKIKLPNGTTYDIGMGNTRPLPYYDFTTLNSEFGTTGTSIETYFKNLIKKLVKSHSDLGNMCLIGKANPNTEGICIFHAYDLTDYNDTGMPRYCYGRYFGPENSIYKFGTWDGGWSFYLAVDKPYTLLINRNGTEVGKYDARSAKTINIEVPTKVSQLTNDSGYVNTDHTYNFSGTNFISGNSGSGKHNANSMTTNGVYYYTSNGPTGMSTNDGGMYVQAYNTNWVGQIAQDYRNGRLAVRGHRYDTGVWTTWNKIYDEEHKPSASDIGALPSTGTAAAATKLANARTLNIGNTGKTFDGSGDVSWTLSEIGAAASSHNHNANNITSGTLDSERLPTVPINKGGTGATTAKTARANIGAVSKTSLRALISANAWTNKKATVIVSGVTENNDVIVTPAVESGQSNVEAFINAKVLCTSQGTNWLTFSCTETPTINIAVNVLILD